MLIKRSPNGIDLPYSSEITPREVFESRRAFIRQMAVGAVAGGALLEMANREAFAQAAGQKLAAKPNPAYRARWTSRPRSRTPAPTTITTSSAPTRPIRPRTPAR